MSNLPESTVYGGPKSKSPWKRVTLRHLEAKYLTNQPITMVTAYDYPSGQAIDQSTCDALTISAATLKCLSLIPPLGGSLASLVLRG